MLARWEGCEPTVLDQNFGQGYCALSVADGAVLADFSCSNCGLWPPVHDKIKQSFDRLEKIGERSAEHSAAAKALLELLRAAVLFLGLSMYREKKLVVSHSVPSGFPSDGELRADGFFVGLDGAITCRKVYLLS